MKFIQHTSVSALVLILFILPSRAMEEEQIFQEHQRGKVHLKRPEEGEKSNREDVIHVTLKKLEIGHTIGNDIGREEGAVNLTVGGQNTTLFWTGYTGKNRMHTPTPFTFPPFEQELEQKIKKKTTKISKKQPTKTSKQVSPTLFIGKIDKEWLEFHASVTESDEEDKEKWTRASNVIQEIGNVGNSFPPYGTLVSQGANVISQLGRFISTLMHDTQELNYSGNLTDKNTIEKGDYTLFRDGDSEEKRDIKIILNVDTFLPTTEVEEVRVILKDIEFPEGLATHLKKNKELTTLEIDVNDQIFRREFLGNSLKDEVFKIENVKIYQGKWPGYLPFSASLTSIKNDKSVQLKELIKLNSQIRSITPVEKNEVANKTLGVVDTISSAVLAGLSPSKTIKLFSVGKTVLDGDPNKEDVKLQRSIALYNKEKFIGDIVFKLNIQKLNN